MKLKSMIGTASLSTLAAAMALTALPAEASARDHGNGGGWSHQNQSGNTDARSDTRTSHQGGRGESRGEIRPAPQTNGVARGPQGAGPQAFTPQQPQLAGRGEGRNWTPQERSVTRTVERSAAVEPNRTYGDPNRNRTYADGNRGRSYGATDIARTTERYNGNRSGRYDGNRNGRYEGNRKGRYEGNRHYEGNYNRWNNNWRNDRRYDWRDYRNSHRNVYHLGAYYSPYRDWSYRRLSVGFYLDSLFYSERYWIDDPWEYRLPDAYGPYHWVRYYDDALLVDVYSGEVVDVIPDFFW